MKLILTCSALLLGAIGLHAQVLLNIQITSPDTMVITSTGIGPVTDDDSQTFYDGIDLLGLFTPTANVETNIIPLDPSIEVTASTLTTGDSSTGPVYDTGGTDSFSEPNADLNIYVDDLGAPTQSFTYGSPAFALGTSISITFTGLTFSGIDYGVILSGYSGSGGPVGVPDISNAAINPQGNALPIGVYHVTGVTPEPSTYALLLGGLAMLAFRLRRKLA